MKKSLFILLGTALTLWPVSAHEGCEHEHAEHAHEHGESCTHDHAEHEEHEHEHGESCSHDHAEHEEHAHEHGESCTHDHAEHEEHAHEHGESCSHDHAEHEEHAHEHGEGCTHDHADHEEHAHEHGEGCTHDHAEHDHAHGSSSAPVVVRVDARSRHVLNMQVESVPEGRGMLTHSMYGTLTVPEHATETYALPCAGFITLKVKSAQQVKAGDVLYTLVSPELNDRSLELRKAEAAEARCKDELAVLQGRQEKIVSIGVANSELQSQLHFKEAELRQLTQERATAAIRLQMMLRGGETVTDESGIIELSVRARSAGVVRNVGITQGSWGEQGAPVVEMSHPAAMEIRGELYSGSIPAFESIRATIPAGRENVEVAGTWRLSEQADAAKQTRTLFFTPQELPAGARPGQLCRMDLYAAETADTVSVPDSAIVRVGLDDIVFTEVGEGTYVAVTVHAGESRRGMTPVAGLPKGQKIVVKGGQELKQLLPSAAAAAKKPGHFHADGSFHEGEH